MDALKRAGSELGTGIISGVTGVLVDPLQVCAPRCMQTGLDMCYSWPGPAQKCFNLLIILALLQTHTYPPTSMLALCRV